MATLKAVVRQGRVVVDERVDFPEGTELELEVINSEDELNEEELSRLDQAIAESRAQDQAGLSRPASELIAKMRAAR